MHSAHNRATTGSNPVLSTILTPQGGSMCVVLIHIVVQKCKVMTIQQKEAEAYHESKTFVRGVVSSLVANMIFAVFVGSGVIYGYRRNWFDKLK